MSSRKGSANLWWIIIGAVIALVVVIVLLVMFTDKTQGLQAGLSDCGGKGICVQNDCPRGTDASNTFSCNSGSVCCVGIPKKCDNKGIRESLKDNPQCGANSRCEPFGTNNILYCTKT